MQFRRLLCALSVGLLSACCSGGSVSKPTHPRVSAVDVIRDIPTTKHFTFHVDNILNYEGREVLGYAFDVWSKYSRGLVQFTLIYDLTPETVFSLKNKSMLIMVESGGGVAALENNICHTDNCMVLGLTAIENPDPVILLVGDRLPTPGLFYEVAAHEIGHAIGLRHVLHDKRAMMYPMHQDDGPTCPSRSDMVEFCKVIGCSMSEVDWC